MLRKKRREKDGHKDPLLVEVNRLQENIMKEIAELHKESDAADKKQSELDKVAQILGINIFEKARKPSVETKDSSEKNSKSENAKGVEKTSSSSKVKSYKVCVLMTFPLREEGTGETAGPKHLVKDHLMSFVTTSHTLALMVHVGESQCISVYNVPRVLCNSAPLTVFYLGIAEVLFGLNGIMSVCSCLVSIPYQKDRLIFSLHIFCYGLSGRSSRTL